MITAPDFNDAHTGESEDLELKCQQLLCSYIELIGSWWGKKRLYSHGLFHTGIRSTPIINIVNDMKSLVLALGN